MADVRQAIDKVISVEIGPNQIEHQLSPGDSGNYNSQGLVGTTYGYSGGLAERTNAQPFFANGIPNPDYNVAADKAYMENLAHSPDGRDRVISVYENNQAYSLKIAEYQDQRVANVVLDHAIHNDPTKAAILLQTELAINNPNPNSPISIDGKVGEQTLNAMHQHDQVVLHNVLVDDRVYGYGNYMGNTQGERTAFQERVLDNYPKLPMTPEQEKQYNNMLHVQHLQEYVGVKADGIAGGKTQEAVNQFHQQHQWDHTSNKMAPEFVQGLQSWAHEKGIIESTRDSHPETTNNQSDTKSPQAFSNHQGTGSDSKSVQEFSNHHADTVSNHNGHHQEGRSESRQTSDQKGESTSHHVSDHSFSQSTGDQSGVGH